MARAQPLLQVTTDTAGARREGEGDGGLIGGPDPGESGRGRHGRALAATAVR